MTNICIFGKFLTEPSRICNCDLKMGERERGEIVKGTLWEAQRMFMY